jgi:hypothetical protein
MPWCKYHSLHERPNSVFHNNHNQSHHSNSDTTHHHGVLDSIYDEVSRHHQHHKGGNPDSLFRHRHNQSHHDNSDARVRECVAAARESPASFMRFIEEQCDNAHWRPQNRRMEPKYWPFINFVGHMETIAEDAERLLRRIGAWENFGAHGWGSPASENDKQDNDSIFSGRVGREHATGAHSKLLSYLTPKLEQELEEHYADDYTNPVLNLTSTQINL